MMAAAAAAAATLYNTTTGDKTILGTSSELPEFSCENAPPDATMATTVS